MDVKENRTYYISQKWPLLNDKDLIQLQRSPENIVIKLQKIYHYSKFEAYKAYFEVMKMSK